MLTWLLYEQSVFYFCCRYRNTLFHDDQTMAFSTIAYMGGCFATHVNNKHNLHILFWLAELVLFLWQWGFWFLFCCCAVVVVFVCLFFALFCLVFCLFVVVGWGFLGGFFGFLFLQIIHPPNACLEYKISR